MADDRARTDAVLDDWNRLKADRDWWRFRALQLVAAAAVYSGQSVAQVAETHLYPGAGVVELVVPAPVGDVL